VLDQQRFVRRGDVGDPDCLAQPPATVSDSSCTNPWASTVYFTSSSATLEVSTHPELSSARNSFDWLAAGCQDAGERETFVAAVPRNDPGVLNR
jgi:hypothetical protein